MTEACYNPGMNGGNAVLVLKRQVQGRDMPAVMLHVMRSNPSSQLATWDKAAVHAVVCELVAKPCKDIPAYKMTRTVAIC